LYRPSYGATAAQYYLRQHADHVRSVVLDSGTLLEIPIFERVAANSQQALEILFARCEADSSCSSAFPRVRSELATVLSRLATAPVTTSVAHPWTGDPIVVDASTFANVVHQALLDARYTGDLAGGVRSSTVFGHVLASRNDGGPRAAEIACHSVLGGMGPSLLLLEVSLRDQRSPCSSPSGCWKSRSPTARQA
jgi:pimeloyl-ACP methyl ester carboxylesterase